ncbi:MAG TPA: PmoA family protein, partial [Streptomyces sp.]
LSHLYGYDNGDWRWTPAPHRVGDSPADLGAPEANDPSSHTVQLRHLIDDLRRRRRPEASGDDGRRVLAFIAALYQSADTGEPVTPRLITADNPYYHSMNGQPQQHTSIPRRTAAMADTAFQIHDDHRGGQLTVVAADTEIATYVYRPEAPREESPKPYLYPLRTLSGAPLAVFRPWDHRWHKGLQMTLSHVSGQNFWGGPTFEQGAPGHGYVWRENNGAQLHRGFGRVDAGGSEVSVIQRLDWAAATGENWLAETRTLRFHSADVARGIWALDFATELTNAHTETLELGSPTTHGRPDAGYTGLFWRGPRAFTSARIIADGADDDEVMGSAGAWAAISGEHDGIDGGATILAYAGTSSAQAPIKWFSRSDPFACLNPSPAFDAEIKLEPGQILTLRHRFVFIDHSTDRSTLEPLVDEFAL